MEMRAQMNGNTLASATATFILGAVATCAQTTAPAVLTIHADKPVSKVSPTLYGLMTEEINYSYDGGLYAEMVANRTFRGDWTGLPHWLTVEQGTAQVSIAADKETGPSEAL